MNVSLEKQWHGNSLSLTVLKQKIEIEINK
jgi:hypothetical protein